MMVPLPQTGHGCPTNESGVLFGEETGVATRDGDTSVFASFDSPASEFFFFSFGYNLWFIARKQVNLFRKFVVYILAVLENFNGSTINVCRFFRYSKAV